MIKLQQFPQSKITSKDGSPFIEFDSRDWRISLVNGFFQSSFQAIKMFFYLINLFKITMLLYQYKAPKY